MYSCAYCSTMWGKSHYRHRPEPIHANPLTFARNYVGIYMYMFSSMSVEEL